MIRFFTILLVFVLFAVGHAFSQEQKSSRYKSIDKRGLRLDQDVPALLKQAEQLLATDISAALDKVEQALAISITQKNIIYESQCYLLLGNINESINEWESAAENYLAAFERLSKNHYASDEFVHTMNGLARSFNRLGNYDQSLYYLDKVLIVSTDPKTQAEAHIDIAETYFLMLDYEQGLKAIAIADSLIDAHGINELQVLSQSTKTKLLAKTGQIDLAESLYYQNQLIEIPFDDAKLNEKNDASIEASREELIDAYNRAGRFDDEIAIRSQEIGTNEERRKTKKIVFEKQALSKALLNVGERTAAVQELEDAIQLADSIHDYPALAQANRDLAEIWSNLGYSSRALSYYEAYGEAIDEAQRQTLQNQIAKEGILKRQQSILSLSKELALEESEYELQRTNLKLAFSREQFQQFIIYGLLAVLIILLVGTIIIYRNAVKSKTMSQLLALKSLRSQMNPHFIFNALNSINQFIATNDERAANRFLTEFSRLMRLVLDNSQKDFITLAEEKEIIELYLKLEHYRFRDKFNYQLTVDDGLLLDTIEIPPMLIQPYIENAIWHGLRYRDNGGSLNVSINNKDKEVLITVEDNGVGRQKSMELKTEHQKKHNSTGLKNTQQRINIINKVYHKSYSVEVSDLSEDGSGTCVKVSLPENGKNG